MLYLLLLSTWLLFGTVVNAGTVERAAQQVVNCQKFSNPTANDPKMNCIEYTRGGYPKKIAGQNVDLYRYVEGWSLPDARSNLQAVGAALQKTLPVYEAFGHKFNVILIFMDELPPAEGPNTLAYEEEKSGQPSPCYVRVGNKKANTKPDPALSLMRTVAHELYHCVQDSNSPTYLVEKSGTAWWLEGSAEYYSGTFYPNHDDTAWIRHYKPGVPMYRQGYEVALFFQFLQNFHWSAKQINQLVLSQNVTNSFDDARTLMSQNPVFQTFFPEFAKAYQANTITFNDGTPVSPQVKIPAEVDTIHIPKEGYFWGVVDKTFTMNLYDYTFEAGQTFQMVWKPASKQTNMFYRRSPTDAWTALDSDPVTVAMKCSGGSLTIEFLFISTADVDLASGSLRFVPESEENCKCQAGSCDSPLDPCLVGTWNLDIDAYIAYEKKALAAYTASDFKDTGTSDFVVPASGDITTTHFYELQLSFDLELNGSPAHEIQVIDGTVAAQTIMHGSGKFTWTNSKTSGHTKTSAQVVGVQDAIVADTPLSTIFKQDVDVTYVCKAKTLLLHGNLPGGPFEFQYNKA